MPEGLGALHHVPAGDAKLRLCFASGVVGVCDSSCRAGARGFNAALDSLSWWWPLCKANAASRYRSLLGTAPCCCTYVVHEIKQGRIWRREVNYLLFFLKLDSLFTFLQSVNRRDAFLQLLHYYPPRWCMSFRASLNADAEDVCFYVNVAK